MMTADVCVVGGGPAGTATAIRLAELGHEVVLLDAGTIPGKQPAAHLPASILPLLELLGVSGAVESAGFIRGSEIAVLWENERPELRQRPGPPGFHVSRTGFDRLLLNRAAACGVRVISPVRASQPVQGIDGEWSIALSGQAEQQKIGCRFVVDASGGRLASQGPRLRLSPRTVALIGSWELPAGSRPYGSLEAAENEWMWASPLGGRGMVAVVFMDPVRIRAGVDRRKLYGEALDGSRLLRRTLAGGVFRGKVSVCDASIRSLQPADSTAYFAVGDSANKLDPLSSQGVISAVSSGLQAAAAIHTIAKRPSNTGAAVGFYQARQAERATRHRLASTRFHRLVLSRWAGDFWVRRAGIAEELEVHPVNPPASLAWDCPVGLSPGTSVRLTPVMVNDLIEERPAVWHRNLDHPVAFLEGIPVAPLLAAIGEAVIPSVALERWSHLCPLEMRERILGWLWENGLISPAKCIF